MGVGSSEGLRLDEPFCSEGSVASFFYADESHGGMEGGWRGEVSDSEKTGTNCLDRLLKKRTDVLSFFKLKVIKKKKKNKKKTGKEDKICHFLKSGFNVTEISLNKIKGQNNEQSR